ncbi:MAG: 1-acyl-sn-glycerol-3-phosphate acyltransferase [Flavobacteriaceae bacterium]|nr:1-acyl-sn-glycerol-3-phosphate acyltransferase [Flavobacteriaceae bacterium]
MFESIAPYNQLQIEEALQWLTHNKQFMVGVKYFHPMWSDTLIIEKLNSCSSCADFQVNFIEPMIRSLIEKSIDTLTITGLDTIDKNDNHLYISNHRDIFLDSGLLQYTLYHKGYPFTEISLGDNLIVDEVIHRVSKLNNMFTVYRTGTKLQLLQNAKNLSAYLRFALTEKKVSSWIAQGNGRTKDGNDKTFPGLVNMLLMSAGSDLKIALQELHIVISTISYEYEPCAVEKAIELQTKEETGNYTKSQYENMNSIVKGIEEHKGEVVMHFEKLDVDTIDFSENRKEVIKAITNKIDKTVYKSYHLFKTNYIAYDMLNNTKVYNDNYTVEALKRFKEYINQSSTDSKIQNRLLKMYSNPVINKLP